MRIAIFLLSASAMVSPIFASIPVGIETGTNVASRETSASDQKARQVVGQLAACTVRRGHDAATALVLQSPAGVWRNKFEIPDECRSVMPPKATTLRITSMSLAYAVAEVLVRNEIQTLPLGISNKPPLAQEFISVSDLQSTAARKISGSSLEKLQETAQIYSFMSQFGECIVRADPVASHRLILSNWLSSQESSALAELNPVFGACVRKGETLKATKAVIRGAIAQSFYRLAKAPAVSGSAAE